MPSERRYNIHQHTVYAKPPLQGHREVTMKRKTAVIVIICSLVAISVDFTALIYGSPFVKTVAILLGIVIVLDLIFIALMYGSD